MRNSSKYVIPRFYMVLALTCVIPWTQARQSRAGQREMRAAFQHLERLTGRTFKRDVPLERQSRDEFQAFLRREMKKTFPGDDLRHLGRIYSLLAMVPLEYQLEEQLPRLYKDQVGAYYDPKTETIYQVAGDLAPASRYFLYLHEGVHALQDQYYDLETKQTRYARRGTLDQQIAFSFVTEGHANLVAMAAQMGARSLRGRFFQRPQYRFIFRMSSKLTGLTPGQFETITRLLGGQGSPSARSLSKLRGVPLILVQQMTDPYLVGQYLLYQRSHRVGYDRALDWLRHPPRSSQQLFFRNAEGYTHSKLFNQVGDYETTIGSYLIMRWLNVFSSKPQWAGEIRKDRVSLIGNRSDRAVLWRFRFEDVRAMDGFLARLGSMTARLKSNGEAARTRFTRNQRTRYLWYRRNENRVWLVFDDDRRMAPEMRQSSLTINGFSALPPRTTSDDSD